MTEDLFDEEYFSWKSYILWWKTNEGTGVIEVPTHECDTTKFFDPDAKSPAVATQKFYCLDLGDKKLQGNWNTAVASVLFTELRSCDPTKLAPGKKCKSAQDSINKIKK